MELLTHSVNGEVSVVDLSQHFGVSEMTIRRDLDWLAEKSMVTRVYGGAVMHQADLDEKAYFDRLGDYGLQKVAIGRAAQYLIQDNESIILDAGTTTHEIARNLASKQNLVVITNNLPAVVEELVTLTHVNTIVLGGMIKGQEVCTVGVIAKQILSTLTADKLFLSASGFSLQQGITDSDFREVEIKQAMIQAAKQVILVVDSSKYNVTKLIKVAPLSSVQTILTDDALPAHIIAELEATGIVVVTPSRITSASALTH
jgi:DeoR/GlpR family transcriptional regulator of sugar metabolism